MRIALYAGSLVRGGTERVLVTLAHNFMKQGHEVFIVTTFKCDGEYEVDERIPRIISGLDTSEETTGRIKNIIRRFEKLNRIWKEIAPDKIISFIGKNNFNALLTAGRMGIPVSVAVRADPKMEYPGKLSRLLVKILYPKASHVILQTKDSFSFFSKRIIKKAIILKNPINPIFFDRKAIEFDDREKTIIAVGRVDENKNHKMLIDAFYRLAADYPEYKLVILGDGELRQSLLSTAYDYNNNLKDKLNDTRDRIFLPGLSNDVPSEVEKARLFVLCSDTEGVPNTILEAMAVGTPVISTDCPCGGPKEIIQDGINGYLVPVRNVEALEVKIRKAIDIANEDELKRISQESRKIAQNYREDAVSKEWLASL